MDIFSWTPFNVGSMIYILDISYNNKLTLNSNNFTNNNCTQIIYNIGNYNNTIINNNKFINNNFNKNEIEINNNSFLLINNSIFNNNKISKEIICGAIETNLNVTAIINNSNFLNYNGTSLCINLSINTIINNCIFTKSYSNIGYSLHFEKSIIIIKNTNIFNLNSNGIYAFGLLTNFK